VNDAEFVYLMKKGIGRVYGRLDEDMPQMASRIQAWMKELAGSEEPVDYFLHPAAFPLMLLPWWIEEQLQGAITPDFQTDLIASNSSMYYYIRLVDNIMDGHATVEPKMLPAAGYFVSQFQGVYHPYFNAGHPFWDFFQQTWSEFCDVTAADGHLTDVDEAILTTLVGHKVCAAKISVAAVLFNSDHADLLPVWNDWIDLFGCWHLFQEDVFDWQQDLQLGTATYFLSEARRRKRSNELEVSWIAREGLDWAFEKLAGWMARLRQMDFGPPEVAAYLDLREDRLYAQRKKVSAALEMIRKLSDSTLTDRSSHVSTGSI